MAPHPRFLPLLLAPLLCQDALRASDGADITVLKIASDASDYTYFGTFNGVSGYAFGTTSCNPGTLPVNWTPADHPVIGQNMFRLRDGLFEHIGQSWLKHGFCAVNETGCGSCQITPCDTLGIGCADTYNSFLNDGAFGGPKWQVNPTTGVHADPYPFPTGPAQIAGRLQIAVADIDPTLPQNQAAIYIAEGQYISAHESAYGNGANSASWQLVNVINHTWLITGGSTVIGQPGIFAWRALDPEVHIESVVNADEGGHGIHGNYFVGSRATQVGPNRWRYVYAVQNLNSKRAAGSFSIPLPAGLPASAVYFRDVDYHSGEPYDGTDWSSSQAGGFLSFACTQDFATDPNANALRWGTLYTFAFEIDSPPQLAGGAKLGLFEPGAGSELVFQTHMPGGSPPVGTPFCFGDGTGALCPCFNFGATGSGCENSYYTEGAQLRATGAGSLAQDDVRLFSIRAIPGSMGIYIQGDTSPGGGNGSGFGDGLRCASWNVRRLETVYSDDQGSASSSVTISDHSQLLPGDIRTYQFWYRDRLGLTCGAGFNLTNGVRITWGP